MDNQLNVDEKYNFENIVRLFPLTSTSENDQHFSVLKNVAVNCKQLLLKRKEVYSVLSVRENEIDKIISKLSNLI
jgi:hypothetical protein